MKYAFSLILILFTGVSTLANDFRANASVGEFCRDGFPRKWKGLDGVGTNDRNRTMCDIRAIEFASWSKEYILDMLERHNSGILVVPYSTRLNDQKDKIEYLRRHGIKFNLMFTKLDAYSRLPESENYKRFFLDLEKWAPLSDVAGMDEWFLSPAVLNTDGGTVTEITENFLDAFAKYAGYSKDDARWAFKNNRSDDPRAVKAWEFCDKVQNDFAREFVKVAKKANPEIKTWISYVGKNWNKSVTCIDSSVKDFDEILQCQTYWYGRAAEDPLNSPLVTAPIGMGKLFRAEYPDKFFWMGVDPGYTGVTENETNNNSWGKKCYGNAPEEVVPYLALLYAVSDGVFVQSPGGGVWLLRNAPGIDVAYADRFADMVNLVSRIVPLVKSYRKSDIAYYYDPAADWETIRRVNRFIASRETNETSIGFLQQFCDVDITADVGKYENVVYSGVLLPAKFDYKRQHIYLMYAPEYDEKGNKISGNQLSENLSVKSFEPMGKNFFPANSTENGCEDQLQISGLPKNTLASGMIIKGASYPTRKAAYSGSSDYFLIGARNKEGNVLLNSLWPSFTRQDTARKIIKKDLDYFGWTAWDCPQVNGVDKVVAVAFKEGRTAVIDFGKDASFTQVKVIMFNGREGIIRNETVKYERGMKIEIPPLNVLVVYGK